MQEFGEAVREVLGTHPDLASEQCWQRLGALVAEHWALLCKEQPALSTWTMLTRCSEAIVRLRRAEVQAKGASASDALEEFRTFMSDVIEGDGQGQG